MKSIKLVESDKQIQDKINTAISKKINDLFRKKSRVVLGKLKRRVDVWVRSQPEIKSLLKERVPGELNSQFGFVSGQADSAVNQIVEAIVSSTIIEVSKVDKKLNGKIIFKFQPANFSNLLGLSAGFVTTAKGQNLHWLDWILKRGDSVIIVGYKYQPSNKGRSGGGRMVTGDSFRVPPSYSGTAQDNFITRAFSNRNTEIANLLSTVFK